MTGQCQCGCAGFTRSEEYVWYYHSGRGTVRLFRRHDAAMVANYALAAEATALVSTSWSLVAGDREGGLTMLAITDPAAGQQAAAQLLASLPSRQRGNTEPVNGGLMRSPLARYCTALQCALYCTVLYCTVLARFRAAVRMALLMDKLVAYLVTRKRERKKKRKKGEILELLCKVS